MRCIIPLVNATMEYTTMRSNTAFILYNNVTLNNETSFNNAMYK